MLFRSRHILLTLAFHMNPQGGQCFPSIATLMRETRLSNRTIITHLERAVSEGWITRVSRGTGKGWKRHEYNICFPSGGGEKSSPRESGDIVKEVHHENMKAVNLLHRDSFDAGEPGSHIVVKEVHTNIPIELPIDSKPVSNCCHLEATSLQGRTLTFHEIKDLYEKTFGVSMAPPAHYPVFSEWSSRKPREVLEVAFQKAADRNVKTFAFVKKIVDQ